MRHNNFNFTPARQAIVDSAYEAYHFGSGAAAESADGWNFDGMSDVTRIACLDVGEEGTVRVSFHVRFADDGSDRVEDVYALLMRKGGEIGHFPIAFDDFNKINTGAPAPAMRH